MNMMRSGIGERVSSCQTRISLNPKLALADLRTNTYAFGHLKHSSEREDLEASETLLA